MFLFIEYFYKYICCGFIKNIITWKNKKSPKVHETAYKVNTYASHTLLDF